MKRAFPSILLILGSALIAALILHQAATTQKREFLELQATQAKDNFGVSLPQGTAIFETSLQDRISASDTSMTLVNATTTSSEAITGYNCFTIDEGRTDAEFVCGTVSGSTVSSLERGLSLNTATTTIVASKHAHRKGANVKITDFPLIQRMRHQLNGSDTIENLLTYKDTVLISTNSPTTTLATKYYVDNTASAGAANASISTKGLVEIATGSEAASSTSLGGTGAIIALPASMATDTPTQSAASASKVVMSDLTGFIKQAWLKLSDTFAWTGAHTWTADATFNGGGAATTTFNRGVDIDADSDTPFILNTLSYIWPTSFNASSTVLKTNATGRLIWEKENPNVVAASGLNTTTSGTATSTVTVTVPSGSMSENSIIKIHASISTTNASGGTVTKSVQIGTGTATSTLYYAESNTSGNARKLDWIDIIVGNNNSFSAQTYSGSGTTTPPVASFKGDSTLFFGSTAINTAAQFFISFNWANGASEATTLTSHVVQILK